MKAEELMIDDWLCYEGEHNVQVKGIDLPPNGNSAYISFGAEFYPCDSFSPIPLTTKILEKNGFKRDPIWHYCDKDLDDYSISVQLGYANRIEYVKIAEKGKDNVIPSERTKLYLTHIKYVHDLQHALRLCGITSEIII